MVGAHTLYLLDDEHYRKALAHTFNALRDMATDMATDAKNIECDLSAKDVFAHLVQLHATAVGEEVEVTLFDPTTCEAGAVTITNDFPSRDDFLELIEAVKQID